MTKARQLETGLDLTTERLGIATLHLEGKEKQLATCEGDLEEAEEHADIAEDRIFGLEGELRFVANLKSLEVAEEKANQREKTYKEQLMMYVNCLKLVDVQKVRPG